MIKNSFFLFLSFNQVYANNASIIDILTLNDNVCDL